MKISAKLLTALGIAAMATSACFGASASYNLAGTPGNGTSGNNLSGTVSFSSVGTALTIVLTNTSTLGNGKSSFTDTDLLQGLFFGNTVLPFSTVGGTATSNGPTAVISTPLGPCTPPSLCGATDVGPGWNASNTVVAGFQNTLRSAAFGVSSSGGPQNPCVIGSTGCSNFPSGNGVYYLDGANYGISPSGFPASSSVFANGSFQQQPTVISLGSVTFTLTTVPVFATDADLIAAIGDVRLQFGRDLGHNFVQVPEPAFYSLVSLGGIAVLLMARRRRSQNA